MKARNATFPTLAQLQSGAVHRGVFLLKALARYKINAATGCWEWTGVRDRRGYGKIWTGGLLHRAHRVFYSVMRGPIPEGQILRHTCDNPPCVNPDHLLVGTQSENLRDAYDRGRKRPVILRGADSGSSTMDEATAQKVVDLVHAGVRTRDITAALPVNRGHVNGIKRGQTWRHLTPTTASTKAG